MRKATKWHFQAPDCLLFSGYKPCSPGKTCPCPQPVPFGRRILIVNLDFIGDVLMTTTMLAPIRRKYPKATIDWITQRNAMPVLANNPFIHRAWEWNDESRLILESMEFDMVLNADKNQNSAAFTMRLSAKEKWGFGLNKNGAIVPLNRESMTLYTLGLDDDMKFHRNTRSGPDLLAEAWKLEYRNDDYVLVLTEEEKGFCAGFRKKMKVKPGQKVVGLNTGCSALYPLKKMTVDQHVVLVRKLAEAVPGVRILLLGGKDETEQNRVISRRTGGTAVPTPTDEGLRRGILYENACDIVVSGDTLGMHIAIGLKKWVIAWFGLSCSAEINLYGRGEKILTAAECAPCWKKTCERQDCLDMLDLDAIVRAVKNGITRL